MPPLYYRNTRCKLWPSDLQTCHHKKIKKTSPSPCFYWSGVGFLGSNCRTRAARINGHDPYVYLRDILTRLPLHPNSKIEELLPQRWQPTGSPT
jgi:hypothetical protein